jgi:NADH-quinone oxidoreductase subunit M
MIPRASFKSVRSGALAMFGLVLALVATLVARSAFAAPPSPGTTPAVAATGALPAAPAGRIVLTLPSGARGPLVLAAGPTGWSGVLKVTNVGDDPLAISRIAVRGDEEDARSPPHVTARFAEGAPTSATIPAGGSREVVVSWVPDHASHVEQAFGHVVLTSTDEWSGEVAMGFRAQRPTGLGWIGEHALSLLVLWPLVVALVAAVSRLSGRRDAPVVRQVAIGAAVGELLLAVWAFRHFAPDVGRSHGNEGFQLIERSVWVRSLGAEWYLGVDGTSVLLVVLAAAVGLVAVLVADETRRSDAYYATLALLASGVAGSIVALDLALDFASRALVLLALVVLVGSWGGARAHRAAAKVGAVGCVGLVAMLLAFAALSGGSGRTFLVDGTAAAHTMAIPELARTSFATHGTLLGVPFVDAVWLLLFLAVATSSPLVPFHGWLPDALEEAPLGVAIAIGGMVTALGPFLLVRVGLGALPEGARWGGPSMAGLGAIGAAWGALCAVAQRDVRRFAGYAAVANAGLCLYGIGSLTPQGIAGALAALFAHGLASALLLGAAGALEARARTGDVTRLQGLVRDAPALAVLVAAALAASLGAPGLVGSWALLLALVGGFVQHPFFALVLAGALVVSAAAHFRMARILLLEPVDAVWRRSRLLAPYGGRLPDATPTELVALAPLAAIAVGLGLWPVPILSPVEVAARDASAVLAGEPTAPEGEGTPSSDPLAGPFTL